MRRTESHSSQLYLECQTVYSLKVKKSHLNKLYNQKNKPHGRICFIHRNIWVTTTEASSPLSATPERIMKTHSKNNFAIWRNWGHKIIVFPKFFHMHSEFSQNSILCLHSNIFHFCILDIWWIVSVASFTLPFVKAFTFWIISES